MPESARAGSQKDMLCWRLKGIDFAIFELDTVANEPVELSLLRIYTVIKPDNRHFEGIDQIMISPCQD